MLRDRGRSPLLHCIGRWSHSVVLSTAMDDQTTIQRTVTEFVDSNPTDADQLLPLLQFIQDAHGHVAIDAVPLIAAALNISRAEVFGVLSFYDNFHATPRGVTVEVCGSEACQALGCAALFSDLAKNLDQSVTVEEIFCLGNCVVGPNARVGDRIIGRATRAVIEAALVMPEPEG
jgi:formate dehydrogenase subunit gamma